MLHREYHAPAYLTAPQLIMLRQVSNWYRFRIITQQQHANYQSSDVRTLVLQGDIVLLQNLGLIEIVPVTAPGIHNQWHALLTERGQDCLQDGGTYFPSTMPCPLPMLIPPPPVATPKSSDVRTLDPKRRRAAVLKAHQSGMTCRQISAALGMSKSRVSQLLAQARRDVIASQRATIARALTARLAAEEARRAALRPTCPLQAELLTRRALAAWSALGQERT